MDFDEIMLFMLRICLFILMLFATFLFVIFALTLIGSLF